MSNFYVTFKKNGILKRGVLSESQYKVYSSDNSVSNLEWMTAKENNNHGTRNERAGKAISKSNSIPIIATNLETGNSTEFYGISECARQLGLYNQNICKCLKGRYKQTGGYTFKYKED